VCKGNVKNTLLKCRKNPSVTCLWFKERSEPLSGGVMTMIIKMCVLKSLSGASLKGVGNPSPSPGKISSMRRLAYLLIDLLQRRAAVCAPTPPPKPIFILGQITYLLVGSVLNSASDFVVEMAVSTAYSPPLIFRRTCRPFNKLSENGRCSLYLRGKYIFIRKFFSWSLTWEFRNFRLMV
jgi:hypothetical protein